MRHQSNGTNRSTLELVYRICRNFLNSLHYEENITLYGAERLKVVYKNKDSLLYRIKTTDQYENRTIIKHLLDISDYPVDLFLHEKPKMMYC